MVERETTLGLLASVLLAAAAALTSPSCLSRWQDELSQDESSRCTSCHGDARRDGDALLRSAPPRDLLGASDTSYPGVGAHLIHLQASGTHAAIACAECHVVPETTD